MNSSAVGAAAITLKAFESPVDVSPGDAPARDLVAGAGRDFESYALDKESLAQVDEFLEELSRFAEGRPLNLENPNPRITIGVRPEIH